MQATVDTRPEDLIVTPVLEEQGKLRYVASALVTAMVRGGVAILDEGNRMSEKSWASLAPLLDSRRYVESIIAGIKIKAHPLFRFVATMNDDASTFDLPEYIQSRLQPQILLDFPERDEDIPRSRNSKISFFNTIAGFRRIISLSLTPLKTRIKSRMSKAHFTKKVPVSNSACP